MLPTKHLMTVVPGRARLLMAFLALGACGPLTPVSPPVVDALNLAVLSAEVDAGAFGRIASVVVVQSRNYNTPGDFEMSRELIERFILEVLADPSARTL